MNRGRLFTYDEVAKELRVSKSSIERWVREGRLRVVRPSPRTPRVEERELDAFWAGMRRVA